MQRKPGFIKAIFWAGFVAGTLDITSAIIKFYIDGNAEILKLFRFIASGVFGKEASSGGPSIIFWGLLIHYIIAYIFTIIFFLIYPSVHKIIKSTVVAGLLYGIIVWVIMNRIVLPLSNTPKIPFNLTRAAIAMLILMMMIGLPISFFAHRYYQPPTPEGGR